MKETVTKTEDFSTKNNILAYFCFYFKIIVLCSFAFNFITNKTFVERWGMKASQKTQKGGVDA